MSGTDKAAFVGRFRLILSHWPSADRLAKSAGVSPSAFRKWLKGDAEPSRERLVALARVTGVGVAWLAEGAGPQPSFDPFPGTRRRTSGEDPAPAEIDWSQFVVLPRRRPAVAAGAQAPSSPVEQGFVALGRDWIRKVCGMDPDNLAVEIAIGDSMTPTIRNGNTLLIDASEQEVTEFGIYVISVNGQRLVKRVQRRHDGSLVLISDNPAYLPDVVERQTAATVEVFGRVIWTGGLI